MEGVDVSPVREEDLDDLERAFQEQKYHFLRSQTVPKLDNPDISILIARYGIEIVWVLAMKKPLKFPWTRYIEVVQVIQKYHKQRIATLLLEEAEALVRSQMHTKASQWQILLMHAELDHPNNVASKKLLESNGYQQLLKATADLGYYKEIVLCS